MAKIDNLQFTINNENYKSNINVGKNGVFTCNLNWQVSKALGLATNKQTAYSLVELKTKIVPKYKEYLQSKTVRETYILITYKSNGHFNKTKDGYPFKNNKFNDRDGFSGQGDRLTFDFDVYIKESYSTGTECWFTTQRGRGNVNYGEDEMFDADTWYKKQETWLTKGVQIPFTIDSYNTLEKAREGIRSVSEILFNFLNQDTELISAQLNKGNLLGNRD